jgi:pimeloyl-ACP methyl ester carboxylesterase
MPARGRAAQRRLFYRIWPGTAVAAGVLFAGATACGGNGGSANSSNAKASPESAGAFTVHAADRSLSGRCEGKTVEGKPTYVLEAGQGNGSQQLQQIADVLARSSLVCTYDRAGFGSSDPASRSPRRVGELVEDLNAVLERKDVPRPYVLVGHSLGALVVLLEMQRHPGDVAGVVAMNPGPTFHDWLRRLRGIVTPEELRDNEIKPLSGDVPEEPVDVRASDDLVTKPFPQQIPYPIMFAEDCGGGTDRYCKKVVKELEKTQRALAKLSSKGRFIKVTGAGHEIYLTDLDRVVAAIKDVAARSN